MQAPLAAISAAPLADAETLTSSGADSKSLEAAAAAPDDRVTLVTTSGGSGEGGGDTIVDSELPSLPTDGVVALPQEEPVSLSDINLTLVKSQEERGNSEKESQQAAEKFCCSTNIELVAVAAALKI